MAETSLHVGVTGTNDLIALNRAAIQSTKEFKKWSRDTKIAFEVVNNSMLRMGNTSRLAFNQLGVAATKAQRDAQRFASVGLQQVGYQVGDFAVQLQGGTNAAVAFGQQMSQLLGILGPYGAIAGAGVAIGTAFVAPLIDGIDLFGSALKSVKKSIKELQGEIRLSLTPFESQALLDVQDAIVSKLLEIRREEEIINALRASGAAIADTAQRTADIRIGRAKAEIDDLREQETILLSILDLREQRNSTSERDAFEVYAENEKEIEESLKSQLDSLNEQVALSRMILQFGEESEAVENLRAQMARAAFEARVKEAGAAGKVLKELMAAYDAQTKLTKETETAKQEADLVGKAFAAIGATSFESTQAQILALAEALGITLAESTRLLGVFKQMGGKMSIAPEQVTGKKDTKPVGVGGNVDLGSSKEETQTMEEYVAALEERLLKERELIGLSEEVRAIEEYRIDLVEDLTDKYPEMSAAAIQAAADEITAIKQVNEELEDKQAKMEEVRDTLSQGFEDFFMSIIDGSKTVGEAFADLAQYIISELLRILVIKPLVDSLVTGITGILGLAQGGVFTPSGITPFAKGGVINSPTVFPFANGIGLMGEAGPEAIMPLKRTPSGDLGVIAQGTGGGSPVNVVVNNYGKDDAMVDQQPNGDIVVTVGKAVAQDIANGGATYQAMRKTFGLSQTIKRRG